VFCPRHDPKVYQNRNLHMSLETAEIIAKKLGEEDYRGKISFTGFSETYLNKNFFDIAVKSIISSVRRLGSMDDMR